MMVNKSWTHHKALSVDHCGRVSLRKVWLYSNDTVSRHGDIGCKSRPTRSINDSSPAQQ
jgi:hypothetical protein